MRSSMIPHRKEPAEGAREPLQDVLGTLSELEAGDLDFSAEASAPTLSLHVLCTPAHCTLLIFWIQVCKLRIFWK